MHTDEKKFSCIILAGGEGKRVDGQDKGLLTYKDKTLVQHVIDRVSPQVNEIIISANRNIEEYKRYGYPVISDVAEEYRGPMAGIAAALPYCNNEWVLIVPCDMPFLPDDIVDTLSDDINNTGICIAEYNQRLQLVFFINKKLLPSLTRSLQNDQLRLMQWVNSHHPKIIKFSKNDSFKNLNHTEHF